MAALAPGRGQGSAFMLLVKGPFTPRAVGIFLES